MQRARGDGVLIEMQQAERSPFVGIVLAVAILCIETLGLFVYMQRADEAPVTHTRSVVHRCTR